MKNTISLLAFLPFAIMIIVSSCSKDAIDTKSPFGINPAVNPADSVKFTHLVNDSIYATQCADLKDYFRTMAHYSMPTPSSRQNGNITTTTEDNLICTTTEVSWSPEFNELYLTSPLSNFYPGMMFDGNTIATGAYKPILAPRDSVRISVSIPVEQGLDASIWVHDPNSIADVRNKINELLYRVAPGATPAAINFEINQVQAEEEIKNHIGANFSGWGAKIEGSYDFSSSSKQTKMLIRFMQSYYTIDVDAQSEPCFFFDPVPTVSEAEDLFGGTSPVYVSSVNYGRAIYYMIESSESTETVDKAFSAAFNRWGMGAGIDLSQSQKSTIANSNIKALLIGGAADGAVQSINGIDDLKNFIIQGADFSVDNNLGVPISYRMKFVNDGSDAKVVLASNFVVRECEVATENLSFTPIGGDEIYYCANDIGGDQEFGSNGPLVKGKFKLIHENQKIYLDIHCTWDEVSGDTKGEVKDKLHIYSIPQNKIFAGFEDITEVYFQYTDTGHGKDYPNTSGGSFISWVQCIGDTDGIDLGCDGDEDANVRFKCGPVNIKVRPDE